MYIYIYFVLSKYDKQALVCIYLNLKLIHFKVFASLFLSESVDANRQFLQKFREISFRVVYRILKK